jgi:cell shape-determining protein MreC
MIFGGKGDSEKIEKLEARVQELEAENKRLSDALGFYADPENWTHDIQR